MWKSRNRNLLQIFLISLVFAGVLTAGFFYTNPALASGGSDSSNGTGLEADSGNGIEIDGQVIDQAELEVWLARSILHDLEPVIRTFVILLIIIFIMAVIAERLKLPYTIVLVLAGLVGGWLPALKGVELSHDLVFFLFLPPLLFEGAIHLKLSHLRENLKPILVLATIGVAIAIVLTGWLVHLGTGIPIILCLLFGSLISATDPVSVLSIVKKIGAPKRLATILEGESLFNDGTAVVFFTIIHTIAVGNLGASASNPIAIAWTFIQMVAIGGGIGFAFGYIASHITKRINDHLIEITLSTIVAFSTFLVAEHFHASGVIAVVTAGITIGNLGFEIGMSPTTRLSMNSFWEYLAFLINSLVFLLVGIQVKVDDLVNYLPPVGIAIVAVLISRAVAIYILVPIISRFDKPIPPAFSHVFIWGGLRGALSMALALSLSPQIDFSYRIEILEMTFGVAVFSLLIQGLTVGGLVNKLKLNTHDPGQKDVELAVGRLSMYYGALEELARLHQSREILPEVELRLRQELKAKITEWETEVEKIQEQHGSLVASQTSNVRKEILKAAKSDLLSLKQAGTIGENTFKQLQTELDAEMDKIKMMGEE
ncbi:MAG TPA: Na+/H+ antiporter [bacterium]|jgi:CPA1 family monovalent cation:H+ antiporter